MAAAKKCDRCGRLYDFPICNDQVTLTLDNGVFGEKHLDLCDNCYEELTKWLNLDNVRTSRMGRDSK